MDLFTPNVLETPSLFTPMINENSPSLPSVSQVTNPPTASLLLQPMVKSASTSSDDSSASNEQLAKLANEFRQSFRQPTESPFFSKSQLPGDKTLSIPSSMENGYPSTADVMHDIESLDRCPMRENSERESEAMVGIVSLKKRLIIRSQSRTECPSPPQLEGEISHPLPVPKVESAPMDISFGKVPLVLPNTKRTLVVNEVTSSDPMLGLKRAKVVIAQPVVEEANLQFVGTDDQRKKQIRDSNREAARRCRERRRNYIEQLEGNLEQHKQQIKQLAEKLSQAERVNTQLRAVLTEANIFQARHVVNDGIPMEFQRTYLTRPAH